MPTIYYTVRSLCCAPLDANADKLLSSAVSWIPGASTSTIIPSQGTTSSAPPLQQPSSATLTALARAFVPSRPAPPLQQPSSSTLSAKATAFIPPRPTPPLQQPSTTTLSASARAFVPPQLTPPLQHPATTTLSGSARVFVPPQPTPPLHQPSSATALVPPQPTPPLQQPSSAGPTTPLQPPSAQTPIDSQGGLFLRACRNTVAHHHQNVWNATKSVGTDELDAIEHIQAAVLEGLGGEAAGSNSNLLYFVCQPIAICSQFSSLQLVHIL
ncbi:proline-rich extensin-like protein EPR1 [Rhododendron vialii]|uniref:proline-rich extensin-like protein EPR1 n=1 Tax=Rhododendron vialii TaxID=182163 RepID=UPI00265DBB17|nr:proline-rich extensin-like protein EPR1 [Rhododendron vialii]